MITVFILLFGCEQHDDIKTNPFVGIWKDGNTKREFFDNGKFKFTLNYFGEGTKHITTGLYGYNSDQQTLSISIDGGESRIYLVQYVSQDNIVYYDPTDLETISLIRIGENQSNELNQTANCYIVTSSGSYEFKTVKGNSLESVGNVSYAEVLWESYGSDKRINVGDLINNVRYEDGRILYKVASPFKEGNAVIAAKDVSGKILWSWHIWLTDKPKDNVYNNAVIVMDRNLGATSAMPGDVGALGLMYQWGRKDPFLGSSSISKDIDARSTIVWPVPIESTSITGTISYAIANPTTFITDNGYNWDWYYTGSESTDNTRWHSFKTIYDPCPAGWRVPDGGENGVWSNANLDYQVNYDSINHGILIGSSFSNPSAWYPAAGYRSGYSGSLCDNLGCGRYSSVTPYTPNGKYVYAFCFMEEDDSHMAYISTADNLCRGYGASVRCVQE